jgi:hypothetical protein
MERMDGLKVLSPSHREGLGEGLSEGIRSRASSPPAGGVRGGS